jgi:predicted RNA-binding Zn ribbon-like protein
MNKTEAGELIKLSSKDLNEAGNIFQRALNLRESLFKIFSGIIEGAKPEDENIEILNREFAKAIENQSLAYRSNKFEWKFSNESAQMDNIIWKVADSAIELLTSDLLHLVKICPGENCGWLFLDATKNKSRQWCDMKDCGNLAKVRRYREKQK